MSAALFSCIGEVLSLGRVGGGGLACGRAGCGRAGG